MTTTSFLDEELKKIDLGIKGNITRFSFSSLSIIDLLSFCATEQVFYFESKNENLSYLGLGKTQEFSQEKALEFLEKNPELFLAYQAEFEGNKTPHLYLPEWCFVKKGDRVELTINPSLEYGSYSPSNIIFNTNLWESFVGKWVSYEERPERDEWEQMINESLRLIKKNTIEKIVLSRKKIFTYNEPIELLVMFRELYQSNTDSSHFTLYHQFNYQEAFISFSPESLFTIKDRRFESISLAGSTLRGVNQEEDQQLEAKLISSDKLAREHDIVTKSIIEKLKSKIHQLKVSPLFTMKLPYIQHRMAYISGTLNESIDPIYLINILHPTPAVGGIPNTYAKEKILEIEREKREYYAAPFGIISKNFTEIAVGIRSAHLFGSTMTVYGGAGIVSGSTAEDEWIETGVKMRPFIKVINKAII